MAKIIFSTISGLPNAKKLPCFYVGWVNALLREGNDVMLMITNDLMVNLWSSNESKAGLNKTDLDKAIVDFNPDLVITCNNSLYENIPHLLSCPIVIYAADSPAVFSDRGTLKNSIGRYDVIAAGADSIPMITDYFGAKARSVHLMHFATDFVAENVQQDTNISFIGTDFSFAAAPFKKIFSDEEFYDRDKINFKRFLNSFKNDVFLKPQEHLNKLELSPSLLKKISHIDLLNLLSSNFRIQTLQSISELGLSLYGSKSWVDVCNSSVYLALSYSNREISSIQDNQDIYNSSKISINISHAQAGCAFSWRVRDIMACNSVLVSDPREDLVTQFGKYVKIPTYETPYEARQICQKLLQDDVWRKEIIAGSQLAIEEGHRFKHRLKDLEEIFGLKLFCERQGNLINVNFADYYGVQEASQQVKQRVKATESIVKKITNLKKMTFAKDGKLRSCLRRRRRTKKAVKEFKQSLKTMVY
jgi:hypothetical protein